jgi:chromosome segregation ATPase|tara:strand:- start:1448 stop:2329 length:882 start_codon:yes stop_codon:yes gene_type:complete
MAELQAVETPRSAGFVDPNYNNANKRRIQEQEAELNDLMNSDEEAEEEQPKAAAPEAATEDGDEKLSGEERTYKKRYSDLRSHQNKQAEELKAIKAQLDNAQERGDIRPPKSDEDIEAWSRQYPDVAAIVERIAEKKAQEKFSGAESRLQEIDRITAESDRNRMEDEIRAMHPDFNELRSSDEFHDWAGEQPKWVQDALYENSEDPASVTRVIDLYKVDKGLDTKTRKKSSKAAASAVVTKRTTRPDQSDSTGNFSESQVHKMSAAQYDKQSDAIMEAIRAGKFDYDMTGGAR